MDNLKDFIEAKEYVNERPSFTYLTIPYIYTKTYYKLLLLVSDIGKNIIDDCSSICKGDNKHIISCWNLFQSALAAYTLEQYDKAEFFIKYIDKQLALIYKNNNITIYTSPIPIVENGTLKTIINLGDYKFYTINEEVDLPEGYEYIYYIDDEGERKKVLTDEKEYIIYKTLNN